MIKSNTRKGIIKKETNGITLIALVVTIIVLLILAGISISMLLGDNGILIKASDTKIQNDKSSIIEDIRIEILGSNIENSGKQVKESQLVEILKKYFDEEEVDKLEIPEDLSTSNIELTSKEGNYKIKLSEIYEGKITSTWVYNHSEQTVKKGSLKFNIGDKIKYTNPAGSGYDGDWQVLGVGEGDEDGLLLLISEGFVNGGKTRSLIGGDYATPGGDPLKELRGAVKDLDETCAVYKNENATKARSIKAEDINRLTGYDPENTYLSDNDITQRGKHEFGTNQEYGITVTYKIESSGAKVGYKYGSMVEYSTDNTPNSITSFITWGAMSSLGVGVESQPVKSINYFYHINTLGIHRTCNYEEPGLKSTLEEGYENSNRAYNMIKLNNDYWLATPCVATLGGIAVWGLRVFYSDYIVNSALWNSIIGSNQEFHRIRAVVSLKLDIIPELKS